MKVRRKVIYSVFDLWLNTFDMGKLMKEFGKISKRKKKPLSNVSRKKLKYQV